MSEQPKRIQRKRVKDWTMPPNTVYVGRPTKWGNPWTPAGYFSAGYSGTQNTAITACVEQFRAWFTGTRSSWGRGQAHVGPLKCADGVDRETPPDVSPLRGKNLACWCPLDQPCHADVLLELANSPSQPKE